MSIASQQFSSFKEVLTQFGNPHLRISPVIHVAGTNGKGSTIAFLRSVLEAAGHTVHVYTSPHLINVTERFVCRGRQIDQHTYEHYYQLTLPCGLGYFAQHTLMAFLMFSQYQADYCLIEVGVGGEFDPTNVITKPLASIITTIDLDHTDRLGPDILSIARAKSGIMKPACPIFVGTNDVDILKILSDRAQQLSCPLYKYSQDFDYTHKGDVWTLEILNEKFRYAKPAHLVGDHQLINAALAIMTLRTVINPKLGTKIINQGLLNAKWSGRLESVTLNGKTIWFDGAHNPAAAKILTQFFGNKGQLLHVVMAQQPSKDTLSFIQQINPIAHRLHVIPLENKEAFIQIMTEIFNSDDDIDVLITGSLYLYAYFMDYCAQS